MSKKWKIVTALSVVVISCGLYTWGIPAVVNIKAHKSQIENLIYKNTKFKVDIGSPELSMGMFPSVWIKSDNVSVLNDDGSKAASIDSPKVQIKLLPLIKKKIEVSNFSAKREEVFLEFTKDSQFKLGQYLLKLPEKKGEFELSKMNLELGEYNIYLDDLKYNQKIKYSGKYLKNVQYIANKHASFSTDSILYVGDTQTDIMADIDVDLPVNRLSEDKLKIIAKVDDFNLASLSHYVNVLSKGKITDIGGIVSLNADTKKDKFGHKNIKTALSFNDLKILGKDDVSSIIYPGNLSANINFGTIKNGINFKNTTIESDKIHAKLDGQIYNLGKEKPAYNLTAKVDNTRLEDVVLLLPWTKDLPKEFNFYKLKKYKFYGRGDGELTFVGQGVRPKVTGKVKLRDAYLIHPMKGANANASIDLNFKGEKMYIDVHVPATNNQYVDVNGKVLIDGSKYSELVIKSSDSVLLAPAQEILNPLHEILNFQIGPVPMMKISGLGSIDMRSAGKKVDPHLWGIIKFRDASASFIDVHNLNLYNGSGEVKFDDKKVTFKTYSATINNRSTEIYGDCVVLGKLNVYVKSKGQDIKKLIKTIQTSPILVDVQKVVKPFTNPEGLADVFLHIYGTVDKQAEEVVFNEDLFSKGSITLHNSKTTLQDTFLPFTNVNGTVNFDQYDSDYDVTGFVRNSKIHVWGTGSNSEIDLNAKSDKFKLADVFDLLHPDQMLPYKKEIGNLYANCTGSYKGIADADNIDYNKIKVNGKFLSNMSSSNPIKLDGGTFNIANGFLKTSKLNGLFNENPFTLTLSMKDLDKEDVSIADSVFNFKNFDISSINSIKNQITLPKDLATQVDNITNISGKVDISGRIKDNKMSADTVLGDISFIYKPFDTLVKVRSGKANLRGETLYLDKVTARVSSMPVFMNGKISNVYSANPNVNLSLSAKLTQIFFDRFFNSKSVYPIKAKGDINLYSKLSGSLNALNAKTKLSLGENASLYYMGATIAGAPTGNFNSEEMTTNPVNILSDVILYPDRVKVNSLNYNQLITSQNKKVSTQNLLNASGEILLLDNGVVGFKNFKVKTEHPTNARIFNVLFKKPTIKQGVFTTDITLNGTSYAPYALGYLNINCIDIPVLDSTVRDVNIDFKKDFINITTKAVVLTNDILMNAKIVNKPSRPVEIEDLKITMDELNLNVISQALNDIDVDNTHNNNPMQYPEKELLPEDSVIIKNALVKADYILIKKAIASEFNSHFTLDKNQVLNIDDYRFKLANGTVSGNISYDLKNLDGKANMQVKDADAQIISEKFFDMPGQMYGSVTGDMSLSWNGISSVDCVKTLSGEGSFNVTDGKMPKLGSLEYLLKAGNLITGGVTGLSINGIIDLITPLKTGNFKSISGNVHVKDGIADDINVYSSGQDLNMYLTGSYNIATLVADMEVYGSLSKNLSTLTGKITNSSLNTLLNTIPGIKINEIKPSSTSNINKIPNFNKNNTLRVFRAEIFGDINGSNYVKSFRWIKD